MRKRFVTALRAAINAFQINVAVVENISVIALQSRHDFAIKYYLHIFAKAFKFQQSKYNQYANIKIFAFIIIKVLCYQSRYIEQK